MGEFIVNNIAYVLLYSRDGGSTWLNMKDESAATPGVLPLNAALVADPAKTVADAATGDESWAWSTPKATFPEGTYVFRVESYRKSEPLHYAYHQEKIYVNR